MPARSLLKVPAAPTIKLKRGPDGTIPPEEIERLAESVQDLMTLLAGGLTFGDGSSSSIGGNVYSQFVDYYFVAANTTYQIPHGLGVVPKGFLVVNSTKAGRVFDPDFGAGWGAQFISLQSAGVTNKVKLLLLG
jgi:hypothetical protein